MSVKCGDIGWGVVSLKGRVRGAVRVAVVADSHWLVVTLDNSRPIGAFMTNNTPTTTTVVTTNKLEA